MLLTNSSILSQGAQTVGMGVEAQSVPAAADLFKKANGILGYVNYSARFLILYILDFKGHSDMLNLILLLCLSFDLLGVCTNGPKEKLDSTVISQVT